MKLGDYLYVMNLTNIDFAALVRVSRMHLGRIISGDSKPRYHVAKIIEQSTDGWVTMDEIMNPENYPRVLDRENRRAIL